MQALRLNNGVEMPALGFGVFQIEPEDPARAVSYATRFHDDVAVDPGAQYRHDR